MEKYTHMKQEVYSKVPQWFRDSEQGQYSVMVGDDIDSLTTATLMRQFMGWEVNWFYDFNKVYVVDDSIDRRNRVGVDMALEFNEKTIDNHVTLFSGTDKPNLNSVNMNVMYGVSRDNYTDKYAMSTLLLAWSLLGLELPSTDEGKKILLSIDSSFKGHYDEKFRETHSEWLRKLGFEELIEFLDTKTNRKELKVTIKNRYNLSEKIKMTEEKQLETNIDLQGIGKYLEIDLQLPCDNFNLVYKLRRENLELNKRNHSKLKGTYSFALTYKDLASYTLL